MKTFVLLALLCAIFLSDEAFASSPSSVAKKEPVQQVHANLPRPQVVQRDGATRPSSPALPGPLVKGISLEGSSDLSPNEDDSSYESSDRLSSIFTKIKPKKDSSVKGKSLFSHPSSTSASLAKSKKRNNLSVSPPNIGDKSGSAWKLAMEPTFLTIPLSPEILGMSGPANGPIKDETRSDVGPANGPNKEQSILTKHVHSNFPAILFSPGIKDNSSMRSTNEYTRTSTRLPTKSRPTEEVTMLSRSDLRGLYSGSKRVPGDKSKASKAIIKTRIEAHSNLRGQPPPELLKPTRAPKDYSEQSQHVLRLSLFDGRINVLPAEAHSLVASNSSSTPSSTSTSNFSSNSTATKKSPKLLENSLQDLVLYSIVLVLVTIVLTLLISICVLLAQVKLLKQRLRLHMEQALAVQNCGANDSTFKILDGTDYWSNFRRILLGRATPDSNCSEGGEFDVAFHVPSDVKTGCGRSIPHSG